MLITPTARAIRHEIDQRLNPGYRDAEPARLLADAYALVSTFADSTESRELKRDCLDSAISIESYLLETLSEVRISKDDVQSQFDEIREEREGWPSEISDEAWGRLVGVRTLRDIADVLCDGGDYWEAIRLALFDEFEPQPAKSEEWSSRTMYLAFDRQDWRETRALAERLEERPEAAELRAIMQRVQARTEERFEMVVWSVQDVLDAVARAKDPDRHDLQEATWEEAGVSKEWVEDVMLTAEHQLSDRMTERGWEILEDIVRDALDE